jgi:hypothetical protein
MFMSNIQTFEQALGMSFPVHVAENVLNRISGLYGAEFVKKYEGTENEELVQLACTAWNGLTPAEIDRGIKRMNSEEFCPTLTRFRSWCEQGGDWWTADMAWAKAMQYEADPQTKITKLTKCALEEVRHVLNNEGQKAAHYAFKDIYQDYQIRAKAVGRVQEWHEELVQLPVKDESYQPVSNTEAQEALKNLQQKLSVRNRPVVKPQELKPTPKPAPVAKELGPDPFDNPEAYAEMCRRDGVPVPRDIVELAGGGV